MFISRIVTKTYSIIEDLYSKGVISMNGFGGMFKGALVVLANIMLTLFVIGLVLGILIAK